MLTNYWLLPKTKAKPVGVHYKHTFPRVQAGVLQSASIGPERMLSNPAAGAWVGVNTPFRSASREGTTRAFQETISRATPGFGQRLKEEITYMLTSENSKQ